MTLASDRARQSLRLILAWACVVLLVVLAAALGMGLFAARSIDRVQAAQEQALVQRTLERRLAKLTEDITSATIWDDAYEAAGPDFDQAWAEVNFGVYYSQYLRHDRTVVIDPAGRVVYASQDGKQAPPASAAGFVRDVEPLIQAIRAEELARLRRGNPRLASFEAVATAAGAVRSAGQVYLVGGSTIVPESAAPGYRFGRGHIVISARRVGPAFLAELRADLGVQQPRLVEATAAVPGPRALLIDPRGQAVGALAWTPRRPGAVELGRATGPVLGVLALFVLAVAGLTWRIHRALKAMAINEQALDRTLRDLTLARDRAEAASVAKSQFLANISHEIRTPMNGVLGMAQVMEMGELPATQRSNLAIIRESGETLLALLNDVLDLAKIEAGKLDLTPGDVDASAVVAGARATFEGMAAAKGLTLSQTLAPEAAGLWRLDGARLRQVLANLISNAVKFTAAGSVTISLERRGERLAFSVVDTGMGIPPERMAELFGKFNQIDATPTRQFGGSGLGLAISRELVNLMGGEIEVISAPGQGSRFSFEIPAQAVRGRAPALV